MHHLLLGAAFAAPLVAFLFPFLGNSHPGAELNSTNAMAHPHPRKPRKRGCFGGPRQWAADEFAFERAIQAYEDLIDATARRLK
jgi:hypothetical protein